MSVRTYYEILDVAPDASQDEIRRAFRRAVREHHPDFHPNNRRAAKRARELNAAVETLTDPERRKRYDDKLRRFGRLPREDSNTSGQQASSEADATTSGASSSDTRRQSDEPANDDGLGSDTRRDPFDERYFDEQERESNAGAPDDFDSQDSASPFQYRWAKPDEAMGESMGQSDQADPVFRRHPNSKRRRNSAFRFGPWNHVSFLIGTLLGSLLGSIGMLIMVLLISWAGWFSAPEVAEIEGGDQRFPKAPVSTENRSAPSAFTNSIGMNLVRLPSGKFQMGSSDGDIDEQPSHQVTLSSAFYMGRTEVTQAQYEAVMGTNPSSEKGATLPVTNVGWDDARTFCRRLSELTEERSKGRVYSLPTEAQWEYACRAGSTSRYCFGDSATDLEQYACYGGQSQSSPLAVGSKRPNQFGLYDMHGNAWEWCLDFSGPYSNQPSVDPTGATDGSQRILRGGSYVTSERFVTSSYRNPSNPNSRLYTFGFRVVLNRETVVADSPVASASPDASNQLSPTPSPNATAEPLVVPFDVQQAQQAQQAWSTNLGRNVAERNSLDQAFQLVPPGSFVMGFDFGDSDERPRHPVKLSQPFWLSTTEVTIEQFERVMGPAAESDGPLDLPVVSVSWEEAVEFCRRLSEVESERASGRRYRLPTEAEWEFACRAGAESSLGPTGNTSQLNFVSWNDENSGGVPHRVAQKEPNAFGIYDLRGNVWEWCQDWYAPYPTTQADDPQGPARGEFRIRRGGSFVNPREMLRSSYRGMLHAKGRTNTTGFRVVLEFENLSGSP